MIAGSIQLSSTHLFTEDWLRLATVTALLSVVTSLTWRGQNKTMSLKLQLQNISLNVVGFFLLLTDST